MGTVLGILKSSEFWAVFIPAAVAVWLWYLKSADQLAWQQYKRREGLYKDLLEQSVGLYESTRDPKKIEAFIAHVRRSWLYAPDRVIEKANALLNAVETNSPDAKSALGSLMLAIRRDLLAGKYPRKTKLAIGDYKHLRALKASEKAPR